MINSNTLVDEFIKTIHNLEVKNVIGHPQIQQLLYDMQSIINRLNRKYQELSSQQQKNSKKNQFTIINISNDDPNQLPSQIPQQKPSQMQSTSQALSQSQQQQSSNLKDQLDHFQQSQKLIKLTQGKLIDKKLFMIKYKKDSEDCPIDMENLFEDQNREVIELPCSHCFHVDCLIQCVKNDSLACPIDKAIYGTLIGDQPEGRMDWKIEHYSCHGYYCDTIVIYYHFKNGIKNGVPYTGTARRAFLPNNQEGQEALKLLQRAFDQKLTFRIGDSDTTGQKNTVVWNVHHKTSLQGGPTNYGYPDPTYFKRLKDELAQKGIK